MQIDRLYFENFRNLNSLEFLPNSGINLIWGQNGQGKTNLLEGIYLFAYLKSFRGAANADLINTECKEANILLTVNRAQILRQLDLKIRKNGRNFFLDGKKPRPIENIFEALRAILFAPDELYPLRMLPAARRNLLDRGIFQLDPSYLSCAIDYDRVLKQRNCLLREKESAEIIRPWTDQLILTGAKIRQFRNLFIEELQPYFSKFHKFLSVENDEVEIFYPIKSTCLRQQEDLFVDELKKVQQREMRILQTCCGPHRDDPLFLLNGDSIRHIASQGQWRTIILSFKTALMHLLHKKVGVWPVLLFDDMSAELDTFRQERLFSLLTDCKSQVFITTTDPQPFFRYGTIGINRFQMITGDIIPG